MSNNNSGMSKLAAMALVAHLDCPQHVTEKRTKKTSVLVETVASRLRRSSLGRNEPCPCGSGKKWKACHGKAAVPVYALKSNKRSTSRKLSDSTSVPEDNDDEFMTNA